MRVSVFWCVCVGVCWACVLISVCVLVYFGVSGRCVLVFMCVGVYVYLWACVF